MNPLGGGDGVGDGDLDRRGAGRGRGRGPWSSNTQDIPSLRRPHHSTSAVQTGTAETRNPEQGRADKSFDDIIQNSTLSVHAAEFVPKSYPVKQTQQHQQPSGRFVQKHSVQDRLQMARAPLQNPGCNYDASQHYPQREQGQQFHNMGQQEHMEQSANVQDYGRFDGGSGDYKHKHQDSNIGDNNSIEFAPTAQNLKSVIYTLILNPGRFTSVVPPLVNILRPYLEFPSQLQEIVKIIIDQSINEGNFRYSGARLCTFLHSKLTATEQISFRWTLFTLCKNETESQTSIWQESEDHTENDQKKCHGLILFLAELVTQMEHTSAFGLGDLLIQLIIVILKKPAPNSVKNICQALKLAGHTLEKDKSESRKDMENMMRALTELVTHGRVDVHVVRMVHSVHELRNGNWGQSTVNSTATESTELIDPNHAVDEPVFYGPDGKVLTAEENKFLEDVADIATSIDDNIISDGEEICLSADEDDVDAAYEEFLKTIPKQIKNQAQK